MADPTNARLRDFDIPVIMPRIAFLELPPIADAPPAGGGDQTPVTTTTCSNPPDQAPVVASTGIPAPKVKLGLPRASRRRTRTFIADGLPFSVSADKPVSDVEVRLLQVLSKGRLRPLGVALRIDPGKKAVRAVVQPTPFARGKLRLQASKRAVRAVVTVTAQDGSVGYAQADFTLRG